MPMRRPRILAHLLGGRLSMRRPLSRTSPPVMRPGGSSRPITAAPVSDLPAPDSPTTPSTSPGAMSNETPSTAVSVPRRVGNPTLRSRTERTGWRITRLPAISAHAELDVHRSSPATPACRGRSSSRRPASGDAGRCRSSRRSTVFQILAIVALRLAVSISLFRLWISCRVGIGVARRVPAAVLAGARMVEEREDVMAVVGRHAPAQHVELGLRRVLLDQREVLALATAPPGSP